MYRFAPAHTEPATFREPTFYLQRSRQAAKLMRYYWDTTLHCVPPATILAAMADAGFAEPRRDVEAAIFSEYTARA
jgi:hypothetical protein